MKRTDRPDDETDVDEAPDRRGRRRRRTSDRDVDLAGRDQLSLGRAAGAAGDPAAEALLTGALGSQDQAVAGEAAAALGVAAAARAARNRKR